jgi:small ligand-binding sensory domain FIST
MQFASAISTGANLQTIQDELLADVSGKLDAPIDLAVLFFTAWVLPGAQQLVEAIREGLSPRILLGVSCESIIGNDQEVEMSPGASLLVASLPGVELQPFRMGLDQFRELLADDDRMQREGWQPEELMARAWSGFLEDERLQQMVGTGLEHRGQLILADPFSTPVEELLNKLDDVLGTPTFGGMASGAHRPGSNALILNETLYGDGVVGVGIGGPVRIDTVVSQGCRPIGDTMLITKAEGNAIHELGRRPALEVAQELIGQLSEEDRQLIQHGLFVGVVMNEYQTEFQRGDFLVRGLMGADRQTGAIVVGGPVRAGQTVQFHVRDADSADEDLRELLEPQSWLERPAGALIFSCNGRGTRMFEEAHHDARTTHEILPGVPLAGFFAMGELGPVGGKSFIHGHTASIAFFRPENGS